MSKVAIDKVRDEYVLDKVMDKINNRIYLYLLINQLLLVKSFDIKHIIYYYLI